MGQINILIDKTIDGDAASILSKHGNVDVIDMTNIDRDRLADSDVLCIRTNTVMAKEVIDSAPRLKIIATATTGTNHIDTKHASDRGIAVIDAKGANADSVADYVFRVLFAITDDAYYANALLKNNPGLFLKIKKENVRRELASMNIGIIGLGNIGGRVARRARAFGMQVKAYDPYVDDAKDTLEDVLACDIITIHAELTSETRGMIDKKELDLLKDDAILINAARAEIIVEEALLDMIKKNEKMRVVLDVFCNEPAPSMFYDMPNCTITPHIAGNAHEAKKRAAKMIAEKIIQQLEQYKHKQQKILDAISDAQMSFGAK